MGTGLGAFVRRTFIICIKPPRSLRGRHSLAPLMYPKTDSDNSLYDVCRWKACRYVDGDGRLSREVERLRLMRMWPTQTGFLGSFSSVFISGFGAFFMAVFFSNFVLSMWNNSGGGLTLFFRTSPRNCGITPQNGVFYIFIREVRCGTCLDSKYIFHPGDIALKRRVSQWTSAKDGFIFLTGCVALILTSIQLLPEAVSDTSSNFVLFFLCSLFASSLCPIYTPALFSNPNALICTRSFVCAYICCDKVWRGKKSN